MAPKTKLAKVLIISSVLVIFLIPVAQSTASARLCAPYKKNSQPTLCARIQASSAKKDEYSLLNAVGALKIKNTSFPLLNDFLDALVGFDEPLYPIPLGPSIYFFLCVAVIFCYYMTKAVHECFQSTRKKMLLHPETAKLPTLPLYWLQQSKREQTIQREVRNTWAWLAKKFMLSPSDPLLDGIDESLSNTTWEDFQIPRDTWSLLNIILALNDLYVEVQKDEEGKEKKGFKILKAGKTPSKAGIREKPFAHLPNEFIPRDMQTGWGLDEESDTDTKRKLEISVDEEEPSLSASVTEEKKTSLKEKDGVAADVPPEGAVQEEEPKIEDEVRQAPHKKSEDVPTSLIQDDSQEEEPGKKGRKSKKLKNLKKKVGSGEKNVKHASNPELSEVQKEGTKPDKKRKSKRLSRSADQKTRPRGSDDGEISSKILTKLLSKRKASKKNAEQIIAESPPQSQLRGSADKDETDKKTWKKAAIKSKRKSSDQKAPQVPTSQSPPQSQLHGSGVGEIVKNMQRKASSKRKSSDQKSQPRGSDPAKIVQNTWKKVASKSKRKSSDQKSLQIMATSPPQPQPHGSDQGEKAQLPSTKVPSKGKGSSKNAEQHMTESQPQSQLHGSDDLKENVKNTWKKVASKSKRKSSDQKSPQIMATSPRQSQPRGSDQGEIPPNTSAKAPPKWKALAKNPEQNNLTSGFNSKPPKGSKRQSSDKNTDQIMASSLPPQSQPHGSADQGEIVQNTSPKVPSKRKGSNKNLEQNTSKNNPHHRPRDSSSDSESRSDQSGQGVTVTITQSNPAKPEQGEIVLRITKPTKKFHYSVYKQPKKGD